MLISSCALILTLATAATPPSAPDLAPGISLVRLFNTIESRELSSGGYKTTQELQNSVALDGVAKQWPDSPLADTVKAINRQDLSTPIPGWTLRIYTSTDHQHYLIRAESAAGASVYSDERGLIQTATPLR